MLTKEEKNLLTEVINEEIKTILSGGVSLNNIYVITLRNTIKKLGLKELYDYDKLFKEV